jgi:hypothetical protein
LQSEHFNVNPTAFTGIKGLIISPPPARLYGPQEYGDTESIMASEQDVKDALTSVVASIESLLSDIKGNESKSNKLTPETRLLVKQIRTQLNTVKSELLDYMSPKTVQTTLF